MTFQVNYLAPYMLTTALTDHIAKVQGWVINVSSSLHRGGNVGWTDLARGTPLLAARGLRTVQTRAHHIHAVTRGNELALTAISVDLPTKLLRVYHRVDGPPRVCRDLGLRSSPACTIVNGEYNGMDLAPAAALVDNARARTRLLRLSTQLTRRH
jgi:hypothetical protein